MAVGVWLVLAGVALLCAHVFVWVRSRRARKMLAGLVGNPPLPIIGNALEISGDPQFLFDFVQKKGGIIEEKGVPYVFWMGPYPVLIISDPEDLKAVNNASIGKPHFYKLAGVFVGDGLITADVPIWKQHIKKLGNTLNTSVVDGYQDLFNDLAKRLIVKLKDEKTRDYATFRSHVCMSCLQAICQTTLGIPSDMLDSIIGPHYLKAISNALCMLINRGGNLFYHIDAIFALTPLYKEMMKCKELLHEVCAKMMEMKRADRREGKYDTSEVSKRYLPLIDVLLDMQQADPTETDEYLKNEMLTFVTAGHDTVAVNITCALLMLGSHPEAQRKCYEEIRSVLQDPNHLLTKSEMDSLVYTDAVIKETLRLYPPVPVFLRATESDVKLKSCTVPKGAYVAGLISSSNRLKSYWGEDANEFRPERWLEKDAESNPAFIPFSVGRRPCVGKRYALPVVKTYVTYLLRSLEFESDVSKMSCSVEVSIKPKNCALTYRERED